MFVILKGFYDHHPIRASIVVILKGSHLLLLLFLKDFADFDILEE